MAVDELKDPASQAIIQATRERMKKEDEWFAQRRCPTCKGHRLVTGPQTSEVDEDGNNQVSFTVGGCPTCGGTGQVFEVDCHGQSVADVADQLLSSENYRREVDLEGDDE